MKKTLKKYFSIIMVLALMLSFSTVALAADEAPGDTTIVGEGSTEYIDLEIYEVTLPTAGTLDFSLDPQGLLGIEPGATVDVDELEGGIIIPGATVPKVINNSSVDLTVTLSLTGTGDATFIGKDSDDETTIAAVNTGTDANILLYVVPSSVNIPLVETEFAVSSRGYIIDSTDEENPVELKFVLDAAAYEVTESEGTYTPNAKPGTGSGTALQLGGYVNKNADWSDFAGAEASKTVGVSAVFSFAKSSDEESADVGVEGIPGILSTVDVDYMTISIPDSETPATPGFFSGTVLGEEYTPNSATDGGTITWSLTANAADDIVIPFYLGEESLVKVERIAGSGTPTTLVNGTDYVSAEYSLTLKKSFLSSLSAATRPIKITTTGGTYTLNLTWAP
jgi:hypothetical protein